MANSFHQKKTVLINFLTSCHECAATFLFTQVVAVVEKIAPEAIFTSEGLKKKDR
jgi:hypothetical protein